MNSKNLKVCFISDTHSYHKSVDIPECDILIHSGDATYTGRRDEVESFGAWMRKLPIEHKIYVPGNHDKSFENTTQEALEWLGFNKSKQFGKCYFLHQESLEIQRLRIYGDGSTPRFGKGWAYNVDRGESLAEVWKKIPGDTNILVTHGPPKSILDCTYYGGENAGCEDLYRRIKQLNNLVIHAFGHIHEQYGVEVIEDLYFINASICTLQYNPTNEPIIANLVEVDGQWKVNSYSYYQVD